MKPMNARMRKLSDLLRKELATLIREDLDDPRLRGLTFNDVMVSKDLSIANIYVSTVHPDSRAEAVRVLNKASGTLRTSIARRIQLRTTPQLRFYEDVSVEQGDRILDLIKNHAGSEDPPQ